MKTSVMLLTVGVEPSRLYQHIVRVKSYLTFSQYSEQRCRETNDNLVKTAVCIGAF